MSAPRLHSMPDGRRVAFRHFPGRGPAVVFLPGYLSDMAGSKATAVAAWARSQRRACLRFDYSGCGESPGDFKDGTLGRWRDEAVALIDLCCEGPVVLVGSSMGGWLMLLVAEALGPRAVGAVGIAAAPDFTDWAYTADEKARLAAGETVFAANPYGPEPTPMHPGFFADAQGQLRLGGTIDLACPVCLIHGQRDAEVPPEISLRLAAALRSDAIQVTLVKDGDHRLSRPQDIAVLLRALSLLAGD